MLIRYDILGEDRIDDMEDTSWSTPTVAPMDVNLSANSRPSFFAPQWISPDRKEVAQFIEQRPFMASPSPSPSIIC